MQPFSITLFATTGDPEGIRHVDKSNWSGCGVVFTKELFGILRHEPGFAQAGLYILVGPLCQASCRFYHPVEATTSLTQEGGDIPWRSSRSWRTHLSMVDLPTPMASAASRIERP